MDDKYSRAVYEIATSRVNRSPTTGAVAEPVKFSEELTKDVKAMQQIICLQINIEFYSGINDKAQEGICRKSLAELVTTYKSFWEVAQYFHVKNCMTLIDNEIQKLADEVEETKERINEHARGASFLEKKIDKTEIAIKEKKRKFNQLASSIDADESYYAIN